MDYYLGLAIILSVATGINATMLFLQMHSAGPEISQGILTQVPFEMVTAIGTITAVVFSVHYSRKTQRSNALDKVLSILNDTKSKDARREIFQHYKRFVNQPYGIANIKNIPDKDIEKDVEFTDLEALKDYHKQIRQNIERVRSDFEQIGIYSKRGLIDKDAFFDGYWRSTIMSWYALRGNTTAERKHRPSSPYLDNFDKLARDAERYWKKHFPEATIVYY